MLEWYCNWPSVFKFTFTLQLFCGLHRSIYTLIGLLVSIRKLWLFLCCDLKVVRELKPIIERRRSTCIPVLDNQLLPVSYLRDISPLYPIPFLTCKALDKYPRLPSMPVTIDNQPPFVTPPLLSILATQIIELQSLIQTIICSHIFIGLEKWISLHACCCPPFDNKSWLYIIDRYF